VSVTFVESVVTKDQTAGRKSGAKNVKESVTLLTCVRNLMGMIQRMSVQVVRIQEIRQRPRNYFARN
jgi:hypothetical protein